MEQHCGIERDLPVIEERNEVENIMDITDHEELYEDLGTIVVEEDLVSPRDVRDAEKTINELDNISKLVQEAKEDGEIRLDEAAALEIMNKIDPQVKIGKKTEQLILRVLPISNGAWSLSSWVDLYPNIPISMCYGVKYEDFSILVRVADGVLSFPVGVRPEREIFELLHRAMMGLPQEEKVILSNQEQITLQRIITYIRENIGAQVKDYKQVKEAPQQVDKEGQKSKEPISPCAGPDDKVQISETPSAPLISLEETKGVSISAKTVQDSVSDIKTGQETLMNSSGQVLSAGHKRPNDRASVSGNRLGGVIDNLAPDAVYTGKRVPLLPTPTSSAQPISSSSLGPSSSPSEDSQKQIVASLMAQKRDHENMVRTNANLEETVRMLSNRVIALEDTIKRQEHHILIGQKRDQQLQVAIGILTSLALDRDREKYNTIDPLHRGVLVDFLKGDFTNSEDIPTGYGIKTADTLESYERDRNPRSPYHCKNQTKQPKETPVVIEEDEPSSGDSDFLFDCPAMQHRPPPQLLPPPRSLAQISPSEAFGKLKSKWHSTTQKEKMMLLQDIYPDSPIGLIRAASTQTWSAAKRTLK